MGSFKDSGAPKQAPGQYSWVPVNEEEEFYEHRAGNQVEVLSGSSKAISLRSAGVPVDPVGQGAEFPLNRIANNSVVNHQKQKKEILGMEVLGQR